MVSISTRGPKYGRCNVCGESAALTEDHVPPKGCYRPTQVELQSLLLRLSNENLGKKSRFSQNGVKYRTLCGRCNNTLLGATYDPPFIAFVNEVSKLLRTSLALPEILGITGQPQGIIRSLLGHLCSQGVDRYRKGPDTEAVRDYLLDISLSLPHPLHIYYWAYPYQSQVMVRDAAYLPLNTGKPFVIWFLKFFPLAFLISWGGPQLFPFHVQSMDPWRNIPFESTAHLPLRLRCIPPEFWPEAPTDFSVLVFGEQAINVRQASRSSNDRS